jgi:hypothetical protein
MRKGCRNDLCTLPNCTTKWTSLSLLPSLHHFPLFNAPVISTVNARPRHHQQRGRQGSAVWPTIQKQLDSAGISYEAYQTKAAGDATLKTREALRNGVDTIAVVGGDGTLSESG